MVMALDTYVQTLFLYPKLILTGLVVVALIFMYRKLSLTVHQHSLFLVLLGGMHSLAESK